MSRSSEGDADLGRRVLVRRARSLDASWPSEGERGANGVLQEFRFFVDRNGRQHFNFVQRVWIDRSVSMAFTSVRTKALETLALNVLALACPPGSVIHGASAAHFVSAFCDECLLEAPREAWVMPRTTVLEWIATQRRRFRRSRR